MPSPATLLDEDDETFTIVALEPGDATIVDDTGVGTITDDDPEPTLSVNDVTVTEGELGHDDATFTVTLSAVSGRAVSVDYATATTRQGRRGDYVAASGTLNFAAGETTKTVTVTVQRRPARRARTRPSSST